ncbi:MAG: EAL domain-containing protein [Betaproteobacteria bacterium]|nr:EAL domain-containing protein [Betaproteobacteria bacterium]
MPGFDSLDALDIVKRSGKDIPFVIYSGKISAGQAVSAMQVGVSDFIAKGDYEKLMPVIERELRGAAARRAARQADARIWKLAFHDILTGLPNQNLFCSEVDRSLGQAAGETAAGETAAGETAAGETAAGETAAGETAAGEAAAGEAAAGEAAAGAVFYLDVDRFMRINSSFGYEAGNGILRQIGSRIAASIPPGDLVARIGGDTFGVFARGVCDAQAAFEYGTHLLGAFGGPFAGDRLELYLTPSIGVALLPADGSDAYELLLNAETAMEVAKRAGGNGMRRYVREMSAFSAERVAMEAELRHAVERGELYLEFQPLLSAASGRMVGAEALLRWNHPQHGLIAPDRFIPIADETGLIVVIGEWVLRRACEQCRLWHDHGYRELMVSVNVSAVQFGQPRLLEAVRAVLDDIGFPARCLQLEITESVLMRDAETTISMLRALKGLGVRIAVDDFGTGYSSLSYLKRFPIDVIKIDKSFVRELPSDDDAAIVQAIMAVAKSLRLTTVAEGVETRRQVEFLQDQQCDHFQGFLFSRPVASEKILEQVRLAS